MHQGLALKSDASSDTPSSTTCQEDEDLLAVVEEKYDQIADKYNTTFNDIIKAVAEHYQWDQVEGGKKKLIKDYLKKKLGLV